MPDEPGIKDFLNPKAALTPGVAGATIIGISTTCQNAFNIPSKWSAIVLSFGVALLIVGVADARWWQKIILTVFNALCIFAVVFGGNQAGAGLTAAPPPPRVQSAQQDGQDYPAEGPPQKQWFHDWLRE